MHTTTPQRLLVPRGDAALQAARTQAPGAPAHLATMRQLSDLYQLLHRAQADLDAAQDLAVALAPELETAGFADLARLHLEPARTHCRTLQRLVDHERTTLIEATVRAEVGR